MNSGVIVVGSLNADTVIDVPRLPMPGDTVIGRTRPDVVFGGKGANQAAAAASFAAPDDETVAMIGCVGDDELGQRMTDALDHLGVDVSAIRRVDRPSGRATIAVDRAGQNLILVDEGANAALSIGDVLVDPVMYAAVLLVQMESPPTTVAAALRHAGGIRILNPAPSEGADDLLELADVIVPNRTELAALAGVPVAQTLDAVVRQVRSLSLQAAVVVTLGADGAVLFEPDGKQTVVPAPRVDVIDTTGAGDCFCGVLAIEIAGGRTLTEATAIAVQAAALSVSSAGARGLLPVSTEIRRLGADP